MSVKQTVKTVNIECDLFLADELTSLNVFLHLNNLFNNCSYFSYNGYNGFNTRQF